MGLDGIGNVGNVGASFVSTTSKQTASKGNEFINFSNTQGVSTTNPVNVTTLPGVDEAKGKIGAESTSRAISSSQSFESMMSDFEGLGLSSNASLALMNKYMDANPIF